MASSAKSGTMAKRSRIISFLALPRSAHQLWTSVYDAGINTTHWHSCAMAKLYFYYASMNAGKSTTLLQADFNYRERGMRTMLWTAALDHRSAGKPIASRIGLEKEANLFDETTDLWQRAGAERWS